MSPFRAAVIRPCPSGRRVLVLAAGRVCAKLSTVNQYRSGRRQSRPSDRGGLTFTWAYALVTVRITANGKLLTLPGQIFTLVTRGRQSTRQLSGCVMFRATWPRTLSLAAITIAMATAGCSSGGSGTTPGSAAGNSTLVIANAVRVDTLDPEANSVNESIWLDQNLYSRLLQPNPTGTALLPDLATSWNISTDRLTYTFHLRNAQFSDGSPVTASDVVFSIDRSRAFKGGSGFLLTPVKTITAPDAHTVVITLSQKHAPLLADLAMYAYSIVPKKLVQAQGTAFFQHPVGSGPFDVTSYKPDSEVDLARNPHFYGTRPKISKVRVLIVPNDNTRVLMLDSKRADGIENPPGNLTSQINGTPGLHVDLF